jgi:hypothetical protein
MAEDSKWKRRFFVFMGARLLGMLTFLAGMVIFFTNVVRPGGSPVIGTVLIVLGLADAVVAPALLKKQWKKLDRSAVDRPGDDQSER